MPRRRLTVSLLLCTAILAACDATPSDPLDARRDLAALLNGDTGEAARPAPLTLQGLLHAAVHKVYAEQGAGAARALVGDLRRLQEQARISMAAGDRETADTRLRAVQAEEISIVLRVFGNPVVDRVITGVSLETARLTRAVAEAEAAGRLLPRARELLPRAEALLAAATAANARGDAHGALDPATRAAAHTDVVRHAVADAKRIPGLDELFDLAVATLRAETGADATHAALVEYNALRRAAAEAVRNADRQRAHQALEAVRAEQIRIALSVLGEEAAQRLIVAVGRGMGEASAGLAEARAAGRDVSRLERMVASARDMNARARAAADAGDPATALDLGSHAAGLINAVRLALDFG